MAQLLAHAKLALAGPGRLLIVAGSFASHCGGFIAPTRGNCERSPRTFCTARDAKPEEARNYLI